MIRRALAGSLVAAAACSAFGSSSRDDLAPSDAGTALDGAPAIAGDGGPLEGGGNGPAAAGPCADAGAHRLMFVTETTMTANLGGQAGAAALCTAMAADAGLPGSYVAWLSTTTAPPGPNLARQQNVPILLPSCEQLAADLDHLTTHGIEVALDITERGLPLPGPACFVWTSTRPDGTPAGAGTCNEWTSAVADAGARVGLCNDGPDSGYPTYWTADSVTTQPCNALARLYCLQN